MLRTHIGRLRLVAWVEGISFVVLLFVAMPLKYFGGNPEPVRIVGLAHGVLFIIFGFVLAAVSAREEWSLRFIVQAAVSSVIPFGTFVFDKKLRALDRQ